jgi:hypothetical protein
MVHSDYAVQQPPRRDIRNQPTRAPFRIPVRNLSSVGSVRRGSLDHVIVLDERHLKRSSQKMCVLPKESNAHRYIGIPKFAPISHPPSTHDSAGQIQSKDGAMVAQWRHRLKSCFSDCHTLPHEPKDNLYPRVSNQLPPTDELAFAEAAVTRSAKQSL